MGVGEGDGYVISCSMKEKGKGQHTLLAPTVLGDLFVLFLLFFF